MTLIACEAELHGSVPRMVSSILSLIGKYAHLNLRVTRCEYHSETKRLPDLLRTNFVGSASVQRKHTRLALIPKGKKAGILRRG